MISLLAVIGYLAVYITLLMYGQLFALISFFGLVISVLVFLAVGQHYKIRGQAKVIEALVSGNNQFTTAIVSAIEVSKDNQLTLNIVLKTQKELLESNELLKKRTDTITTIEEEQDKLVQNVSGLAQGVDKLTEATAEYSKMSAPLARPVAQSGAFKRRSTSNVPYDPQIRLKLAKQKK